MKRKYKIIIVVLLLQIMLLGITMVYADSIFEIAQENIQLGMKSNIVGTIIGPLLMLAGIGFAVWDGYGIVVILVRLFTLAVNTGKGDKAKGEKLSWNAMREIVASLAVLMIIGAGLIWGLFGTFNAIVEKTIPDVVPELLEEKKEEDTTTSYENYINETYFS